MTLDPTGTPAMTDDLDELLADLDPDDMTPEQRIGVATLGELRTLRQVVMEERRGRRLSIRVFAAAVVVVILVLGGYVVRWRAEDARYSRSTCSERIARTEQIRVAIAAGVEAVADYASATDQERRDVLRAVDQRVRQELPPPDC